MLRLTSLEQRGDSRNRRATHVFTLRIFTRHVVLALKLETLECVGSEGNLMDIAKSKPCGIGGLPVRK
ncbi:hypothetical protein YC2023_107427 [Brassica napus]